MKDPNKILAKILAESIINSGKQGNGTFDLEPETDLDIQNNHDIDYFKIDKSDGMIIGLHTDWGGGKTTLIDDVRKILNAHKSKGYFYETINAWQFNKEKKEDLWTSIISYFYVRIIEENEDILKGNSDFITLKSKFSLLNLAKLATLFTGGLPFLGTISKGVENFSQDLEDNNRMNDLGSIKDNISLFYSMQEDIKNILKLPELKKKYDKFILVIDDLDRCTPTEVVNLLDSLKIFLDLPNIIVIVAVDRRHIEKGIYEVYNKECDGQYIVNPDEYLEKIIHLPIDLFLFDDDMKLLNRNSKDWSIGSEGELKEKEMKFIDNDYIKNLLEKGDIAKIFSFGLSNNPRKILRFKRLFKFYHNVFINLDLNGKDDFVTFWLILKLEYGDYFKDLIKNPILFYLIDKKNYDGNNILKKYKTVFYIKNGNIYNSHEELKLKNFILFLNNFATIFNDYSNIITYFYQFQFGNTDINKFKHLYYPIIHLELFNEEEGSILGKDFIKYYRKNIGYSEQILKDECDFSEFENNIIINIFKKETELDEQEILHLKEIEKQEEIIMDLKEIEEEENEIIDMQQMQDNEDEKQEMEKQEERNHELLKNRTKRENNNKFNLNNYIKENNIDLSISLGNQGEMITGLRNFYDGTINDKKRFGIGSKLFFDYIINNFDTFYNLDITDGNNKVTKFDNSNIYDKLGDDHILQSLENNEKRTLFGEIINQMSFATDGPSIGGLVGATDFTQLENIIISNISEKEIEKCIGKMKSAIVVNGDIDTQMINYKLMLDFIEKLSPEAKQKIKRLKKRLIYIFSHFWSLQDIELFPVYYGKSKEGLTAIGLWNYKYGDLDDAISSYVEFTKKYKLLINQLKIEKLNINDFNDTFNSKFKDVFGNVDNGYIHKYNKYKVIQDLLYSISVLKDINSDN